MRARQNLGRGYGQKPGTQIHRASLRGQAIKESDAWGKAIKVEEEAQRGGLFAVTDDQPDKFQEAINKVAEECDQIDCMFERDHHAGTRRCIESGKTGRLERHAARKRDGAA